MAERNGRRTLGIFAVTAFAAAFLLFMVQPLAAKRLLPAYGGSPAVWTVAMLFFQGTLLAGYAVTAILAALRSRRRRLSLGVALWCGGVVWLALIGNESDTAVEPNLTSLWSTSATLLLSLAGSVGIGFFLLSTTAPLLQSWYAGASTDGERDPYFLYIASNAGSLTALLGYPLVLERYFGSDSLLWSWRVGVISLILPIGGCFGLAYWFGSQNAVEIKRTSDLAQTLDWRTWIGLSFTGSSLLLGLTTYLATDLASFPLLWIIPLALYLISFMVGFSRFGRIAASWGERVYPALLVALAVCLGFGLVKSYLIPLHLTGFFVAAVICQGELAKSRPEPSRLGGFYLAISLGGFLGALFNGLIAPFCFTTLIEYPLGLVLTALWMASKSPLRGTILSNRLDLAVPVVLGLLTGLVVADVGGLAGSALGSLLTVIVVGFTLLTVSRHRRRPLRFALTVGALLVAGHFAVGVNGRVLYQERSFFGVTKVTELSDGTGRGFHLLFHGSTLHGQQGQTAELRREPLSYFTRSGPVGDIFRARLALPSNGQIGVAGLGVGSLLAYAKPSENWTVFEIDPAVFHVSRNSEYFSYVDDCRAETLSLVLGDARLELTSSADARFSILFLDAFNSDAIPLHLITREALALYRRKTSKNGLIVFNLSNRYFDLIPVVGKLADDAGLACRVRIDSDVRPDEKAQGKRGSIWAVLTRDEADFGTIRDDRRWQIAKGRPGDRVWTDGHADVLRYLRLGAVATTP